MHTYIDIHMFDFHTHMHTLGWWYVSILGGLSDHAVTHSYAQMLWRLYLNAKVIGWEEVCVLVCFNVHMVLCSYACIFPLTYSQAHVPCWSYATMPYVLMITCSYAHIHWYSHVSYSYICAHTWLMIYHYAWRLKWSCNCTFLCSNALTTMLECWGNWAVRGMCVLGCFNAHMLLCSCACILPLTCLYALIFKCSHTHTHTHICLEANVLKKLDACAITCYDTHA